MKIMTRLLGALALTFATTGTSFAGSSDFASDASTNYEASGGPEFANRDGDLASFARPPYPPYPPPGRGSYFDWARGRDGWGYCYEFSYDGYVLNGGQPVSNFQCEQYRPSYYGWGRGRDGFTYCYQFTPYGVPMNQGRNVPNAYCR